MKKMKKKLSGMTLVEMIVSIAIFGMLAMLLVTLGNTVERHSRAARQLNTKVAVEGPIAEAQNATESYMADQNYAIEVGIGEDVTNESGSVVSANATKVTIEGTLYYVNPELGTNATDPSGNILIDPNVERGDFNFSYIDITMPPPTAKTT